LKSQSHILVTGGTGLVGAHLLAQLCLQGFTVRAIHRNTSNLNASKQVFSYYTDDFENLFNQVEWVESDVIDIPSLKPFFIGITEIYHCAAIVSFKKSDDELMRKTNIEGTANMVNLALHFGIKKFCHVSSIATIDKNQNSEFIEEQNGWNPETNNYGYAITKYGAEMEVWRGAQEGLDVIIVNPGVILGSGFWEHNTGKFFSNAASGFKYYTRGETGFVCVNDVVKAMIMLMQSPLVNERFILVADNKSFQWILTEIAKAMKTKIPFIKVTTLMSEIAWRLTGIHSFFTGKPALITKHSSRASHQKFSYSSKKIEKLLAFEFENISQSIHRSVQDFLRSK